MSTCRYDKLVNIYTVWHLVTERLDEYGTSNKSNLLVSVPTGVIYLKNLITSNWADRDVDNGPVEFSIHEQDRAMIREAIVDAVVHAPELIRQVVCSNLSSIFRILYLIVVAMYRAYMFVEYN